MGFRAKIGGIAAGVTVLSVLTAVAGSVEKGFSNPPPEARTRTWWHWMDRNITKKGITKDLEAMKRAGLGGATILDVCCFGDDLKGPVKTLSPEWFDCINHAVCEARRLGLDLSVANCPGWSSSGGPWIRPEEAMKNLGYTETTVTGGRRLELQLERCSLPQKYGKDVAVLAFPAIRGDGYDFKSDVVKTTIRHDAAVKLPPEPQHVKYGYETEMLWDGKWNTQVLFNPSLAKTTEAIEFELREPREMSGIQVTVSGPPWSNKAKYRILVSDDGTAWKEHFTTPFVRKDGGVVVFPSVRSRFFRVEPRDCKWLPVTGIRFTPAIRIPRLTEKAFYQHDTFNHNPTFAKDVAECPEDAAVDLNRVVDLTEKTDAEGRLSWDAPEGKWTIMRFTMYTRRSGNHPANPEGQGLECDKMSKAGVDAAWRGMMKPIVEKAKASGADNTVRYTLIDSYEVGPQNWTETMPQEFQALRGYSLVKYLPVFSGRYVTDSETSERFLEDFRRTVSDLYAKYYGEYFRRKINGAGVQFELEPYGGPFDELLQGRAADVPMGEFWRGPSWGIGNARLASNVADVNGRRYVQTETFTAGFKAAAWTSSPAIHKRQGDCALASGINRFVFHSYAHQAYETTGPGITMGVWGFHFNRHNTLWEFYRGWLDYLARAQYLLQQGQTVADVLYVTKEDTPVSPTFTPPTPYGWNGNAIDAQTFANEVKAADKAAELSNGRRYPVVVLPQDEVVSPAVLDKARELLARGVAVVRGPKPLRAFGLAERELRDRRVAEFAKIWETLPKTVDEALLKQGIAPDFTAAGDAGFAKLQRGQEAVRWIHRRTDDLDIYFIANIRNAKEPLRFTAVFRTLGKPELWDAETGKRQDAPVWRKKDGRMELPFDMQHGASVFAVFRRRTVPAQDSCGIWPTENAAKRQADEVASIDCSRDWTVTFQANRGAPAGEVAFARLTPFNERSEPGIRYFSGTATYRKTVDLPAVYVDKAKYSLSIDLGEVCDIAELTVNGENLGILWHYPFCADVTKILKPGKNVVEVRVANRWINRLIGDEQEKEVGEWTAPKQGLRLLREFPEGYKDGQMPKGHYAFSTCRPYGREDALKPAGLVGPVRIGVRTGDAGELRLARHFGDHMVLQQGKPVPVWGWAHPGSKVSLSFGGQTVTAVAAKDGYWKAVLNPLAASKVGKDLEVRGHAPGRLPETLKVTDVLVGEVWLLGGQSNMAHGITGTDDWPDVKRRANYPMLRYMSMPIGTPAIAPCKDIPAGARWNVISTDNVKIMSAVGFYFGERLMLDRDVPVGLIMTARGGSSMANWTAREWLAKSPFQKSAMMRHDRLSAEWIATNGYQAALFAYAKKAEKYYGDVQLAKQGKGKWPWPPPAVPVPYTDQNRNFTPEVDFNALIAPLAGTSISGVLWYQGESDGWAYCRNDPAWYFSEMLETMIACWRERWGEDIWFVASELASMASKGRQNGLPVTRVRQHETERRIRNFAVANIVDTGWENDVHPHDKTVVGERLAHLARRVVYGEKSLARMPVARTAGFTDGGATVKVEVDGNLVLKDKPKGFEVRVNGVWKPCTDVTVDGDVLRLRTQPGRVDGVRYLWCGWAKPLACVYDRCGLPLTAFSFPFEVK